MLTWSTDGHCREINFRDRKSGRLDGRQDEVLLPVVVSLDRPVAAQPEEPEDHQGPEDLPHEALAVKKDVVDALDGRVLGVFSDEPVELLPVDMILSNFLHGFWLEIRTQTECSEAPRTIKRVFALGKY